MRADSIEDLLSIHPLKLTPADLVRIRTTLREQRVKWNTKEAVEKAAPKERKKKVEAQATLSLDDLGLGGGK